MEFADDASASALLADDDRRESPRIPVMIEVDYRADDTFLFAYITDISAMGIFIRTPQPEPPGTRLHLRFTPRLPTRRAPAIEIVEQPAAAREAEPEIEEPIEIYDRAGEADAIALAAVQTLAATAPPRGAREATDAPSDSIECQGEVIWINPPPESYADLPGGRSCQNPGMGIRFESLSDEQRERLLRLVRTFAYLDEDDPGQRQ